MKFVLKSARAWKSGRWREVVAYPGGRSTQVLLLGTYGPWTGVSSARI